ncbi:MAG TPA: hypothetical protein VFP84_10035 [Kofleriaceae bacterium]|nr:hypothetical protein [Kofleriaceae bacterium]
MRRLALCALALAACKGDHGAPPPARELPDPHAEPVAPADAGEPDANLDACRAALPHIASLPIAARAQALLDACQPCGDWTPLLAWNTRSDEHGPTRASIERAMAACHAYCDGNAKQRFLGTLDNARGQPTRQPWRLLGEACKAAVSAVPDTRYASAPYFALDRIARAIHGASAIEVALPAVSINGVAYELPSVRFSEPDAGALALSVDGVQIQLGTLPTARLTADGLVVSGDYPGTRLAPGELAAQLRKARPAGAPPIVVLAPHALPASRIVEALRAAAQPLQLAAAAPSPTGWIVAGRIPITLVTQPGPHPTVLPLTAAANNDREILAPNAAAGAFTIVIDRSAQVDDLARLVSELAARGVREVTLTTTNAPPPRPAKP